MRKLTFEVLRTEEGNTLEAYFLRVEENGKAREYIIPEQSEELSEIEQKLINELQILLKDSM